jgi:hypothetical protein
MQAKSAGHALHRRLVFLVVFTIAILAFAQAAHANGNDDHRGNQGSVKVDGDDIDDGPANHPHVLCALRIVVEHGVGAPFDIDFLAQPPTTRAGDDQRLLILHVPAGDNISGLVDLSGLVGGIAPNPQQGFHIFITVHLPGGDKHKVIWVALCPPEQSASTTTTAKSGTTTTAAKHGTTTTVNGSVASSTSSTVAGGAATNNGVPTQVLGENFTKPGDAAATSLATTGSPFSPALAVGLLLGGLGLVGTARRVSGRRLESAMRLRTRSAKP